MGKIEAQNFFKGVDHEDGQPRPKTEEDNGGVDGSSKAGHVQLDGLVNGQFLCSAGSGEGTEVVVVVEGAQEIEGEPQREHVDEEGDEEGFEVHAIEEVQQGVVRSIGHACELGKIEVWFNAISTGFTTRNRERRRDSRSRPKTQPVVISMSLQLNRAPICHGSFKLRLTAASGAPIISGTKLYRSALKAGLRIKDMGYVNQVGRPRESA